MDFARLSTISTQAKQTVCTWILTMGVLPYFECREWKSTIQWIPKRRNWNSTLKFPLLSILTLNTVDVYLTSRSSANIGFAETGKTYLHHLDLLKIIRTHGIPESPTTFSITVVIVLRRVHARSTGDINQLCVEFATPSVCLLMWRWAS